MSLFCSLSPFETRALRHDGGQSKTDEPRYLRPYYELKESGDAFGLEVYLPGVGKGGLDINVDGGDLVITGTRSWKKPEAWTELFVEASDEAFRLRLALNDSVNVDAIHAQLEQGVLRVTLPKPEESKPKKIAVS